MVVTKFQCAVAFVLAVALVIFGARASLLRSANADESAVKNDSKLKTLLKAKLAIAQEASALVTKAYQSGQASFVEVLEANTAVSDAQLELCETNAERIAILERMLAQAKEYESLVAKHVKAGESPVRETFKAKLSRLEIEIALERAKDK